MRLLRWVIAGAGLSLLALSMSLHHRIDTASIFGAPRMPSSTAFDGTTRVKKFGQDQSAPRKTTALVPHIRVLRTGIEGASAHEDSSLPSREGGEGLALVLAS
jgi:hypothetical protein